MIDKNGVAENPMLEIYLDGQMRAGLVVPKCLDEHFFQALQDHMDGLCWALYPRMKPPPIFQRACSGRLRFGLLSWLRAVVSRWLAGYP